MDARKSVNEIFSAALSAVNPYLLVKEYMDKIRSEFSEGKFNRLLVIGFGKASYQMAKAVEDTLGDTSIKEGIVITKYGHRPVPSGTGHATDLSKIKVIEAGHPIPDENGFKATEEIINLLKNTDKETIVLCLISGGGSALLVSPCNRITLDEKQKVTELLLKVGADITELNAVRKHISKVKGGRLAEIANPAKVITLIISDVISDRLNVIASGPTAPDTSKFQDALNVIKKFNLTKKAPKSVIDILIKGEQGLIPETPKEDNPVFEDVNNIIVGNNLNALNAAKEKAQALGLQAEIISSDIAGEARDAGKWLAKKAIKKQRSIRSNRLNRSICLISGGETTVTVRGSGKGGRNTELALNFAKDIEGIEGITLLSAGTDGTDGPTDAAGAIVDGKTVTRAKSLGLNPEEYLDNNDSYNFFKKTDSLLITGPTGTNVMDIQVIFIG